MHTFKFVFSKYNKIMLIKEEDEKTNDYILQKNKKTKLAIGIILATLILITIGVIFSGVFLEA